MAKGIALTLGWLAVAFNSCVGAHCGELGKGDSGAERPKPRLVPPGPAVPAGPVTGMVVPAPTAAPLDPQLAAASPRKRKGQDATPGFSN